MSEKSLMIVNAKLNPDEKEAFAYYSEQSEPLFKKVGGRSITKHKITETLIGDYQPSVLAIMEFPNKQAILNVFESKGYKELITFRDKAFSKLNVYVGND